VHVAVKEVIGDPLALLALNDTTSPPDPLEIAPTEVGGAGAPTTTAAIAMPLGLTPRAFLVVAKHRYDLPVINPATVIERTCEPAFVALRLVPPALGAHVAVVLFTIDPFDLLGENVTTTEPLVAEVARAATTTFVGLVGAPTVTSGVFSDVAPVPAAPIAATLNE
jgi:hypothetical protein